MNNRTVAAIVLAGLSILMPLCAGAQVSGATIKKFPDFLSLRSEFLSALIIATPSRALAFKPTMRDSPFGRVRISAEREGSAFFVLFQRERNGDVPVVSRGNVIIKRDVTTGYVTRVVWFLSDDGLSFISLTAKNEKTIVDYVVAGSLIRGDYVVSRLIYQFFTNTFSYLYDSTRLGLDWSLVLGEAGPIQSSRLASALLAGGSSPAASALIAAANDFPSVSRYMELAGNSDAVPREERAALYKKAVSVGDPRDPILAAVPVWSEAAGIPLKLAAGAMLGSMAEGAAFIALVSGDGALLPLSLAIVPYRNDDGSYVIASFDARTRKPIDFFATVNARPTASVRLFRLPIQTLSSTQ